MFRKKLITLIVLISFVSSALYLPIFAPRAQAIFGFGDLVIDIKALAERIADGIAMALAQRMIDQMVNSTIEWAQTGFEGNPAYATDPKQYFTDIADGVAGEFIAGSDLNFLCSPFQAQIRIALQKQYIQQPQYQCTLTQVVGNIEGFYNDFSQGGWDGWFEMTQNSANNPYSAYLEAQVELDNRIASAIGIESQQLDWNQGFLSWADCVTEDPDTGECLERGPVKTPGTTIKAQLDEVLPSGLDKLISAEHVDQIISAFATGLLTRYVFGPRGLFDGSPGGGAAPQPPITEPGLCDVAQNIPGIQLDQNCNPIISGGGANGGGVVGDNEGGSSTPPNPNYPSSPGVCASDAEIAQFLIDNPGDDFRLPSAFPCP